MTKSTKLKKLMAAKKRVDTQIGKELHRLGKKAAKQKAKDQAKAARKRAHTKKKSKK